MTASHTISERSADGSGSPDSSTELAAKAGLFAFLGRCLEAEPDQALLDLIRGPMLDPLASSEVHFSPAFLAAPTKRLLTVLDEEFTCLFVAPGCIAPYASVFETGRLFQEPADRATAAYEQAGMKFQPIHSGEFPDHVGIMLGFYAHLLGQEETGLKEGRFDDAALAKTRREDFLLNQMGTWIPGWCKRAQGFSMHEFYNQLLALTEAVVWSEIENIASRAKLRDLSGLNQREPVKLDYDADFRKASGL